MIAYYVMTRDLRKELPPEEYRIRIGGLRAAGANVSAYDPLRDEAVPVDVLPGERLTLRVRATDAPRLLTVEESR